MEAMKGFGFALEQHLIEEIVNTMGYLDLPRSERYRNLVILGLDEYAIAKRNSKLRKKKFPMNKPLVPFTVMLPDAINKEIEKVKKRRHQIKRLTIRYLILIGFDKFKRDNLLVCQKNETEIDLDKEVVPDPKVKLTTLSPPEVYDGPGTITDGNILSYPEEKKPVSNDMTIGEKFQAVIDLIRELDLKITIEKK